MCIVLPGQAPNVALSTSQTQQMIKFAVRRPALNAKSINTKGAQILGATQPVSSTLVSSDIASFSTEMFIQPTNINYIRLVLDSPFNQV